MDLKRENPTVLVCSPDGDWITEDLSFGESVSTIIWTPEETTAFLLSDLEEFKKKFLELYHTEVVSVNEVYDNCFHLKVKESETRQYALIVLKMSYLKFSNMFENKVYLSTIDNVLSFV